MSATNFRVFLGAPPTRSLNSDITDYTWHTVSSKPHSSNTVNLSLAATQSSRGLLSTTCSAAEIFPPATLEAAGRRISELYRNVIFSTVENGEEVLDESQEDDAACLSWPPTCSTDVICPTDPQERTAPSFLNVTKSEIVQGTVGMTQTQPDSQETQSGYTYSDASSISRFPTFHFSLHVLTPLAVLASTLPAGVSKRVSVVVAALELDGPDTIRIKKGAESGKQVSLLRMIVGDESGGVCRLTAWREVAETWGASGGVKRGDVVFIENVMASCESRMTPTLSASPYNKSRMDICYRTMPYTREDILLRPDLRLGNSDAAVRKVTSVVRWFEKMAGLS
ncbi:hypothetical protein FISHEDRAFT_40880 [Fistulina hepatica ATCC 64428]|uniref:Shieldin complex subunit 2 first OB fold domain-containing protein n=1 Tax=Fistulina hepatica ATCC 64428 TaxID=1128425 RepID=A0A0D7AHA9_9AGAR|nr:hypothetical protein FISHEDRAFT_40880 [Fistulina hepatica ATCC 64428]